MQLEPEVKTKWDNLYQTGDIELIIAEMPVKERVGYEMVRRCLRSGKYKNRFIFRAAAAIYAKKEKEIANL
jgi:hypothetical protein